MTKSDAFTSPSELRVLVAEARRALTQTDRVAANSSGHDRDLAALGKATRALLDALENDSLFAALSADWEYGVIGAQGQMVNNGDYRVQQTHRRRMAGPWEPIPRAGELT